MEPIPSRKIKSQDHPFILVRWIEIESGRIASGQHTVLLAQTCLHIRRRRQHRKVRHTGTSMHMSPTQHLLSEFSTFDLKRNHKRSVILANSTSKHQRFGSCRKLSKYLSRFSSFFFSVSSLFFVWVFVLVWFIHAGYAA